MRAGDRQIERAFLRLTGDEAGQLAVAAFQGRGRRPHVQSALDLRLVLAVTREALLMEERVDASDEQQFGIWVLRHRR